jgi:hypothetical protein
MMHVLNGDATREQLERSGVRGTLTVWADALHEGPVPAGLPPEDLRRVRVRHFAGQLGEPEESIAAMARGWDVALERYAEFDEVIFWFEHDLFDQLILIRHLHWLSTIDRGSTRFSLICIGSFPGVANFTGLGPLTPQQLATLPPQRRPITAAQIELGREAWNRYRSPDPLPLIEWWRGDTSALPYLEGALRRHFEDFPSARDGLSRSERQILSAVEAGHEAFPDVFAACQRLEERVYMGDTTFWSIVKRLGAGSQPLLAFNEPPAGLASPSLRLALTGAVRDTLAGRSDHVQLNGIDRWMGGVHLTQRSLWRWDGSALRAER